MCNKNLGCDPSTLYPRIPGARPTTSSPSMASSTIHTPSPRTRCLDSISETWRHAVNIVALLCIQLIHQGFYSDESSSEKISPPAAAKKHVTMKCGWICLDCRQVEFKQESLQQHLCKGKEVHKRVLCAGYMCQNCPAISDDIAAFIREDCPCTFDESLGVSGSPWSKGPYNP